MIIELTIGIFVVLGYWWYQNVQKIRSKLNWIPRASGIPFIGNALDFASSTDILKTLSNYQKQYGNLVQLQFIGQQVIMCADYKLTEFILSSKTILSKSKRYDFAHNWIGLGLLTSDGTKWKNRRNAITPSFHFRILEQFVANFERAGNVLIKKLNQELDKPSTDVFPYMTLCAMDNICETAMGVSINAQENNDSSYVKTVKKMNEIIMERNFSLIKFFDILYPLTSTYYAEKKYVNFLHSYTNSVIDTRKKELEKKKTVKNTVHDDNDDGIKKKIAFLDTLLEINIDGKPMSRNDIREEVDTFMFAGHDTTSTAMSFTIYCLAENQKCQQRAFEEQQEIFGEDPNRETTWGDVQKMKYLEQIIMESLRLFPPGTAFDRQILEDVQFGDKIIPKGVSVMIYVFGIHRDPTHYPDPEKFDPNRFDSTKNRVPPYAYLSFSAGPRNCIGQKFAMLEIKLTIAKILRNYKILPATPKHTPILRVDLILKSDNGVHVKLTKRSWKS